MRIGLIDADMMWGKRRQKVFPNLAIMKLSSWHKAKGDNVEWYQPMGDRYDRVYLSKVFSVTPVDHQAINADELYYGGTGFQIRLEDGREVFGDVCGMYHPECKLVPQSILPDEVEHIMPDYTIYPGFDDTAIGFLSRGCPRGCSFCHVAAKEGRCSRKVADLSEWWNGQKNIILCDPNLLACKDWRELLTQLAESGAMVDMNQGMDARLITEEKMEYINRVRWKTIHFAWDFYEQGGAVIKGLETFRRLYKKNLWKSHAVQVFMLTNFDTTPEQDLERVYKLRDIGCEPYVMVYDKEHAAPFYKRLQRWVNNRFIFHSVKSFDDYNKTI